MSEQIEKDKIEKDKIYNCDCLEGMKHIPNASIDAIICDLPYGTTANKWDSIIPLDLLSIPLQRDKDREGNNIHDSQKPEMLFQILIAMSTDKGDTILDNCMGSGTTAVACIKEKRHFIGFELNKDYYDKACRRIDAERRQLSLF